MKTLQLTLIILFLAIISTSCESRSGKRFREKQEAEEQASSPLRTANSPQPYYPTWNVLNSKSVFIFEDYEHKVIPMRKAGLDSILITRTTVVHSDTTRSDEDIFTDWYIPSSDKSLDSMYYVLEDKDTVTYIHESLTFPVSAFVQRN